MGTGACSDADGDGNGRVAVARYVCYERRPPDLQGILLNLI